MDSITSIGDSLMKTAKSTTKSITDLTGSPYAGGRSHKYKRSSRKTKKRGTFKKRKNVNKQKKRVRKTRTRKYKM
jgi:hypothetical protein